MCLKPLLNISISLNIICSDYSLIPLSLFIGTLSNLLSGQRFFQQGALPLFLISAKHCSQLSLLSLLWLCCTVKSCALERTVGPWMLPWVYGQMGLVSNSLSFSSCCIPDWAAEMSFTYRVSGSYLIHSGVLVPSPVHTFPLTRSSSLEFPVLYWAFLPRRFWQSWSTAVLEESKSRVPACWATWSPTLPDSSALTWSLFWR